MKFCIDRKKLEEAIRTSRDLGQDKDAVLLTLIGMALVPLEELPLKRNKCGCGEHDMIGGADMELAGICHRVHLPCYHYGEPEQVKPTQDDSTHLDKLGIAVEALEMALLYVQDDSVDMRLSAIRVINDALKEINTSVWTATCQHCKENNCTKHTPEPCIEGDTDHEHCSSCGKDIDK